MVSKQMNISEHDDDDFDDDDDNNILLLFKRPHTSLKFRVSCLNAITFVNTAIQICHEWKVMLLSLMHWNRVFLTVLKGAGNDL
jgi:hypothetical protein